MSWLWFALRDERPPTASISVEVSGDAHSASYLAVWPSDAKRPKRGMRIDARAIDADGPPAWVSLVLAPPSGGVLFDDPAVVEATRRALALPWPDALSTLVLEGYRFGGSITVARTPDDPRLDADPFATVYPTLRLRVGAGLLGSMPPPVGPGIQRYGAGNPWPGKGFDS